jgi:hypothetical protein
MSIALLACCGCGLLGASGALAETKSFTTKGCSTFTVPPGVSSVTVDAVGGAGQSGFGGGSGGNGDEIKATLAVTGSQVLDVCVAFGGGAGGATAPPSVGQGGGNGGGASGVSRATDFSAPAVVAGGGGGGGEEGGFLVEGKPVFTHGGNGGAATMEGQPGEGGKGGAVNGGASSNASGPGEGGMGARGEGSSDFRSGAGGGGGGGYIGGGGGSPLVNGGGGGGGAGGTDFCEGTGVSNCTTTAGAGTSLGSVTLAYTPPATTLTTSLSGEGHKGEKITVKEGEAATDQGTLSGENAAKAGGTVSYKVYSDSECKTLVRAAGTVKVTNGSVPASESETLTASTYYWQAEYSGDEANEKSLSTCGAEVLTVTPKPATCGKTTIGKSSVQLATNLKRVNRCTVPFNAIVTKLTMYLQPGAKSGSQLIKGIFYEDSKGKPTKRLGVSEQLAFKSTDKAGWYDLLFSAPLKLTAGSYWIGIITGARANVGAERFDSVASAQDVNNNSYTTGPSDPFGSFKVNNEEMSLYATFTAA